MAELEEYIEILKEQLEEKSKLANRLIQTIQEKDQEIILLKDLLNGNSRGKDN